MSKHSNEQGTSLIEALLAIAIVSFIILLLSNLPNAVNLIQKSKYLGLAREIAVKNLEDVRQLKYDNLVNGQQSITDQRVFLLPRGSGKTSVEACSSQVCTGGENIKQVSVTINWYENNKQQKVVVNTLIGEGGLNQ